MSAYVLRRKKDGRYHTRDGWTKNLTVAKVWKTLNGVEDSTPYRIYKNNLDIVEVLSETKELH